MSSFDPAAVRKAVEEFTPRRPQEFDDLIPAKDVFTELRQERASYRCIRDLLTQHCLATSKTTTCLDWPRLVLSILQNPSGDVIDLRVHGRRAARNQEEKIAGSKRVRGATLNHP